MADQDTDRWVLEVLAIDLRRRMRNLQEEVQWTDLVYVFVLINEHYSNHATLSGSADSLKLLHERGIPRSEIERALREMPFVGTLRLSFLFYLQPLRSTPR